MTLKKKIIEPMDPKKEIMNIFRHMWMNNSSPLHRIYTSWEELENHIEIKEEKTEKSEFRIQPCPYCKTNQQLKTSNRGLFPYQSCDHCNLAFFINKDYTLRKLSSEEKESMPKSWIQIIDSLEKKKLSIIFKLE